MKKALQIVKKELYYYDENGKKILGVHESLKGDFTYLKGDCTYLKGDCTYLKGDCTGLRGDCTGLRGDLDNCKITEEERENGIKIWDLVKH